MAPGGAGRRWRGWVEDSWGRRGCPILLFRCVLVPVSTGPEPVSLRFWLFLYNCPQVSRFPGLGGFCSCLCLCVFARPRFLEIFACVSVCLGLGFSVSLLLWGRGWGLHSCCFPECEGEKVRARLPEQ